MSEPFPHRSFVMASEDVFLWFHRQWHRIDQEWMGCPSILIRTARDTLRAEVKAFVQERGAEGPYLIPV